MKEKQVWCIPLGRDLFLIYAPFHAITSLVNGKTAELLRDHLNDPGTVIPEGMDWFHRLENTAEEPRPGKGGPAPFYLGLIPTRACDMRCAYCDFEAGHTGPVMSFEMIRQAVDGYAELLKATDTPEWQMHFFGGEPFTAYKEIVFAVNYARKRAAELKIPTHFEVTTNGFYPEEKCRWIAANFDTVVLSFDGFPDVQNRHRPASGGRDSFPTVCRNADIFARSNCDLIIRSCISSENVEDLPEWAAFIADRFFPSTVVLEPMIESPLARKNGLCPPDPDVFSRNWTAAYRVLQKHCIPLVYSSGEVDVLKKSLCPMGQDALIVSPDGLIGGCWQLAENRRSAGIDLGFGSVSAKGLRIDQAALDHQRELSKENRDRCRDCFCFAHCAGGCLLSRNKAGVFCRMTRTVTLWQLLEKLGYGSFGDALLADPEYIELLSGSADFDFTPLDCFEKIDHFDELYKTVPECDISPDFSRLKLPDLSPDPHIGWVCDGERIISVDTDGLFVKVMTGDGSLRFQLEHSGMTAPEIEMVWTALREGGV